MRHFPERKLHLVSLFALVLFLMASGKVMWAQAPASITGTVEDASGASVPEAAITVTDLETGIVRTTVTGTDGYYRVVSLPVGRYEVKVEKTGFKASVQSGINLVVAQEAVINLRLEVGQEEQAVTVTAEVPIVNTTTSSVSGLVGEDQIKELPLNGRSFDLLITLNASTVNYTGNRTATPADGGNLFSVAGRRSSENIVLMNGVEYAGAGHLAASPGGASGQLLGIDGIREYNVISDTYGAEYGVRPGGQVALVTQSGTNQFHGTLFEFLRNSDLDARSYFATGGVPPFRRNQFGAAAGGPIRKDKTFIFANYEGLRQALETSSIVIVPNANARKGLLPCGVSGFPACAAGAAAGTPTLVPNLNPGMLPYLTSLWPAPNGPELGGGIAEAFSGGSNPVTQDFGTARVDQRFSDKDSLSEFYTIDNGVNTAPNADPLFATTEIIRNQVASAQETHIFSPNVINTFTFGYTRAKFINTANQASTISPALSFVQGLPMGTITIGTTFTVGSSGLTSTGTTYPIESFIRNLFTTEDSVQVIKGNHQFSFGGWFQKIQQNDYVPNRGNGSASFSSLQTILQGISSTFLVSNPSTSGKGWRNWEGAWYAQDSIQLRKNLNVRLGLRDEFANEWHEANGNADTPLYEPGVNGVPVIQTLPRVSGTFNTANNSTLLLSPRVGVAWDPFGNGKTSIRAAGGIYYNMVDWLIYYPDTVPPANGIVSYSNISLLSIIPLNSSSPIKPPCSPSQLTNCTIYSPVSFQPNYKVPTVDEWNFSVEQQLARVTALRVAYVGSRTYHNFEQSDPNRIVPQICSNPTGCLAGGVNAAHSTVPEGTTYIPVGTRPNPYLNSGQGFFTGSFGDYNALQVEVTQRLAKGLQFRANYTFSKNMDTSSVTSSGVGGTGGGPDNLHFNINNRLDYALSSLNNTHQVSANFSYLLPFGGGKPFLANVHGVADKLVSGWQLNGIVTLTSGFPMTPALGSNQSGDGDANSVDRPNLIPGFSNNPTSGVTAGCAGIPTGQALGTPTRWFDPCAFSLPASGTFGNLGRNTVIGPDLQMVNLSLFKDTRISERVNVQFRLEVFNAFNHPNFQIPQSGSPSVFSGGTYNTSSGVITAMSQTPRQIQLGLKLAF